MAENEGMDDEESDRGDGFAETDDGPRFQLFRPREWRTYTRYHFLLAKFLFFGGIAAIVYFCLNQIGDVLFPVFISLLLAYLFDPLVDWFEERNASRTLGIAITLLTGLAGITLFILVLYPMIVDQVQHVIKSAPETMRQIQKQTIPWIEETFDYNVPNTVESALDRYRESLKNYLPTLANRVASWGGTVLTSTGAIVSALINIVMIPVFTFYFLRDFDRIRLKLVEFIPERRRKFVLSRAAEMDRVVGEWVRGQLQVAAVLAVLYAIGLSIAFQAAGIKLRSGIVVGIISGLLNFIPYLGVAVGMVLSVVMVVINWSGVWPLMGVLLVFFIVQMLEGYLITPKIVGDKVGLNPVTVIIVLLIGGEVYGLLGFILAIPVFGALKVLFPDLIRYYKRTPFFAGRELVPEEIARREERLSRAESASSAAGSEESSSGSSGRAEEESADASEPEAGDGDS